MFNRILLILTAILLVAGIYFNFIDDHPIKMGEGPQWLIQKR